MHSTNSEMFSSPQLELIQVNTRLLYICACLWSDCAYFWFMQDYCRQIHFPVCANIREIVELNGHLREREPSERSHQAGIRPSDGELPLGLCHVRGS